MKEEVNTGDRHRIEPKMKENTRGDLRKCIQL